MMNRAYQKQVGLLLGVLPEVAKENCFALHGGTAINLFARNMPRLSVDIDLTYTEIAAREPTLAAINEALARIQSRIEKLRPSIRVQHKREKCKLQIDERGVLIKIEVNIVGRGVLGNITRAELCSAAQEQYDVFCTVPMVPLGQIYGGKLCAALDRQHPRDLFDVKLLLENEGLNTEIKAGLIYGLLSGNRPTHEMLAPNAIDQRIAFENQFEGMTARDFTYDDYENTRNLLLKTVMESLNESDRKFLIDFNKLEPDWSVYPYQEFPSVKWKVLNLEKFRRNDPDSDQRHLDQLEQQLSH
jgi:predicted nucleotidyltransferase component of viral defense system